MADEFFKNSLLKKPKWSAKYYSFYILINLHLLFLGKREHNSRSCEFQNLNLEREF